MNLDNTIDTITQFIKARLKIPTIPRKDIISVVSNEIGLNIYSQIALEKLYLLRCRFASHPSQSKWWDFGEIYDEDLNIIFDSVKTVLIKMLIYESNNRKISANPSKWSDWFYENADMLFEAVWFHRIPM